MRARRGNHAQRLPQRAALGELDVDSVHAAREARNVGGDQTAFVDHDGDAVLRRGAPDLAESLQVLRHQRLLQEFDAEVFQRREHLLRAFDVPAGVRIHANGLVGRGANGLENVFVAIGAEFDFEDGVPLRFADFLTNLVRRVQPDRERGEGRPLWIEAPQSPQRLSQRLADEIMERGG